jgi:hypothetical protein
MSALFAEFGDHARERRREAMRLINEDPGYRLLVLAICGGPGGVPDVRVAKFLTQRLLSVASSAAGQPDLVSAP